MKPFIKPRGPDPAPQPPAAPKVSPGELTILTVAGAIADPAERAAYLDRVCAEDADLRARLDQRLAERANMRPAPISRTEMISLPGQGRGQGGAVALVPMPDMQMTPAGAPPVRHSPIPWLLATVLAGAVGALTVVFTNEKASRTIADHQAQTAMTAKAAAESDRDAALAKALEAQTVANRSAEKLKDEEQQRQAAVAESAKAKEEAKKAKQEAEQRTAELATAKTAANSTTTAALKAAQDQKIAFRAEKAATLEKLAAALIDHGRHGEAVAPAQEAVDLREKPADGAAPPPADSKTPPIVATDARFLLGSALMGKGDTVGAEKEFLTVVAALEPTLAQGGEPAHIKYAAVVKKVAQLYSSTGRKREASEWRHKADAH